MEIIPIYPPYIYSISYDGEDENEFDRLFDLWNDMEYVTSFMTENDKYLHTPTWLDIPNPEEAAGQVAEEAGILEDYLKELDENTSKGRKPDFDSHFHYLGGKYQYELERQPMKSYGLRRPSLLRLYAIKMCTNTYLITGGGIKLCRTIQESPGLKDHVIRDIDRVRQFLRENGIENTDEMELG